MKKKPNRGDAEQPVAAAASSTAMIVDEPEEDSAEELPRKNIVTGNMRCVHFLSRTHFQNASNQPNHRRAQVVSVMTNRMTLKHSAASCPACACTTRPIRKYKIFIARSPGKIAKVTYPWNVPTPARWVAMLI